MRRLTVSLLLIALAATGCAIGADSRAHRLDLEVETMVLAGPASGSESSDPAAVALSVYLVMDNQLVHVTREVVEVEPAIVQAVVSAAIAGPTSAEARSGIWSAIPPGTSVRGARVVDGVATIDLSSNLAAIGGTDEILAIAQIVHSVTALPAVRAVTFLIDGGPTSVPKGNGVLSSRPLEADDYRDLLGP